MRNSRNHLKFIEKIRNIKFVGKYSKQNDKNISIVVGVSMIILEMLENNIKVIHICSEPIYEKHSNKIWKNIIVTKLEEGVYIYKIKKNEYFNKFWKKK